MVSEAQPTGHIMATSSLTHLAKVMATKKITFKERYEREDIAMGS